MTGEGNDGRQFMNRHVVEPDSPHRVMAVLGHSAAILAARGARRDIAHNRLHMAADIVRGNLFQDFAVRHAPVPFSDCGTD